MTTIPSEFIGKWELARHENSEELFAALGLPEAVREKMLLAKNTTEIEEEDSVITIRESGMPGQPDRVQKFKLGEECEVETMFGKRRSIMTLEDGKLIRRMVNPEEDIAIGSREIVDGQMVTAATIVKTGVTGKAIYNKIN